MDALTLSLFVALEAAVLLAVAVLFLKRKNTRLQQRLCAHEQADASNPGFASVDSGYLPYLEKQILDTRARLELSEIEAGTDEDLMLALSSRLLFLAAEKKVAELCNDYPKKRWEHVAQCFRPAEDEAATQAPPDCSADEHQVQDGEPGQITRLRHALDHQRDVIQSLHKVVARVKENPDAESVEQLEHQLADLERRYREANTCIEIMQQENDRLQGRAERFGQRIERVEAEKNESVADLEQQVSKQKQSISDLHELLGTLSLEAEKAAELESRLEEFDLASRDMSMCIQVLEEENQFLQDQVRSLLQLDETASVYEQEQAAGESGEESANKG